MTGLKIVCNQTQLLSGIVCIVGNKDSKPYSETIDMRSLPCQGKYFTLIGVGPALPILQPPVGYFNGESVTLSNLIIDLDSMPFLAGTVALTVSVPLGLTMENVTFLGPSKARPLANSVTLMNIQSAPSLNLVPKYRFTNLRLLRFTYPFGTNNRGNTAYLPFGFRFLSSGVATFDNIHLGDPTNSSLKNSFFSSLFYFPNFFQSIEITNSVFVNSEFQNQPLISFETANFTLINSRFRNLAFTQSSTTSLIQGRSSSPVPSSIVVGNVFIDISRQLLNSPCSPLLNLNQVTLVGNAFVDNTCTLYDKVSFFSYIPTDTPVKVAENAVSPPLVCPAGYQRMTQCSCQACPAGYFESNGVCTPCSAGYYQLNIGQTLCYPCYTGTSSPPGNSFCSSCPLGSSSNINTSYLCAPCPAGTYNTQSGGVCTPCYPGYFNPDTNKTSCQLCPAGHFSRFGQATCTPCSPGYVAPYVGAVECTACPAGSTSKSGALSCSPCPPGSFSLAPGSPDCPLCPQNFYNPTSGQPTCYPCAKGTCSDPGSIECLPC